MWRFRANWRAINIVHRNRVRAADIVREPFSVLLRNAFKLPALHDTKANKLNGAAFEVGKPYRSVVVLPQIHDGLDEVGVAVTAHVAHVV